MKTLGNIIWIIFGGLHIALEYFIAGLVLMITIIGIPFGLQSMKLGMLAIWPFGTKVKWKPSQPGCLSIFMNVLWFFVGGIWIWLTHVFYGLIFCITIIGIPFGKMHFRLAKLALSRTRMNQAAHFLWQLPIFSADIHFLICSRVVYQPNTQWLFE